MIRLVLTIPGTALRTGLRSLLESGPAFQVVHASSDPTLLDQADVWVVSVSVSQDEIRQSLLEYQADVALLVLGESHHAFQDYGSLPLRAWGILPVDATIEEMIAAVQALHAGLIVIYPDWVDRSPAKRLSTSSVQGDALVEPLTDRETEVLQWLAQGLSNKQIAVRLYISEHTVKFHVSSIYGKLGATNRAEAVRLGAQQGLVVL